MYIHMYMELPPSRNRWATEPITDAGRLAYKKKQGKARRIIYDSIREELMPNISSLKTAKECYDTLVNLYEKKAPSQKRVLKIRGYEL